MNTAHEYDARSECPKPTLCANASFNFTRNLLEVMRTMVALVVILHMLYTVAYVNVPLLWSFVTHQSAVLMEV